MKITWNYCVSLALLVGFLVCSNTSQAQIGTLIGSGLLKKKDKNKKGEEGDAADDKKKDKKASNKSVSEQIEGILNFQFDASTPVLNEDWNKGEEIIDAGKMSGEYYIWFPMTNRLEKVFVRWNDYTYDNPSKNFQGKDLVLSIWTKETTEKNDSYIIRDFLPFENSMLSTEGILYGGRDRKYVNAYGFQFLAIDKTFFVGNLPYAESGQGWRYVYWNYDTNKYKSDNSWNGETGQHANSFVTEEKHSLYFLARDKKQFEGLTWEKVKAIIDEKYEPKSFGAAKKIAMNAQREKPAPSTTNELYKNKAWYEMAKKGVQQGLASGKTVLFGYASDKGWKQVTGILANKQQYASYWMVVENSPEQMQKHGIPQYMLVEAVINRNLEGSNYGTPFYKTYYSYGYYLGKEDVDKLKASAVK